MAKSKKYILCISGSRTLIDYSLIDKALIFAKLDINTIKQIISGGAKGVDTNAKKFAAYHKIKFKEYLPDWKNIKIKDAIIRQNQFGKYNAKAGLNRNSLMAKDADILLSIWDGQSKGTEHMINCMKELNKPYHVYQIEEEKKTNSDNLFTF